MFLNYNVWIDLDQCVTKWLSNVLHIEQEVY